MPLVLQAVVRKEKNRASWHLAAVPVFRSGIKAKAKIINSDKNGAK